MLKETRSYHIFEKGLQRLKNNLTRPSLYTLQASGQNETKLLTQVEMKCRGTPPIALNVVF